MSNVTRRAILGGLATAAIPVSVAANAMPSIDDFLSKATPAERARYHANALAEVMGEMHPDHYFISHVRHDLEVAMVVGHPKSGKGSVVKIHVDDGSPLLADDVTGTTAYADWERGRS